MTFCIYMNAIISFAATSPRREYIIIQLCTLSTLWRTYNINVYRENLEGVEKISVSNPGRDTDYSEDVRVSP